MSIQLRDVRTGFKGFERIIALEAGFESSHHGNHEIAMESVTWLAANMCAPLGAIFQRQVESGRTIRLLGLGGKPQEIMLKNGFLEQFGENVIPDTNKTTIQYHRFRREEREAFQTYIATHFRPGSRGLPRSLSKNSHRLTGMIE